MGIAIGNHRIGRWLEPYHMISGMFVSQNQPLLIAIIQCRHAGRLTLQKIQMSKNQLNVLCIYSAICGMINIFLIWGASLDLKNVHIMPEIAQNFFV